VVKAINAEADAWIAFGQPRDAADMVRTLKRVGFRAEAVLRACGGGSKFIELVGQDAEFRSRRGRIPSAAEDERKRQVREAVFAKMGEPAQCRAAQGMPRETVLAKRCAAREARQEKLRAALEAGA